MKDEVVDFMAWLESSKIPRRHHSRWSNRDPLQARVPVARPELTQADIDRWMADYAPGVGLGRGLRHRCPAGLSSLLLRRDGLFLYDGDADLITKARKATIIELLTEGRS